MALFPTPGALQIQLQGSSSPQGAHTLLPFRTRLLAHQDLCWCPHQLAASMSQSIQSKVLHWESNIPSTFPLHHFCMSAPLQAGCCQPHLQVFCVCPIIQGVNAWHLDPTAAPLLRTDRPAVTAADGCVVLETEGCCFHGSNSTTPLVINPTIKMQTKINQESDFSFPTL